MLAQRRSRCDCIGPTLVQRSCLLVLRCRQRLLAARDMTSGYYNVIRGYLSLNTPEIRWSSRTFTDNPRFQGNRYQWHCRIHISVNSTMFWHLNRTMSCHLNRTIFWHLNHTMFWHLNRIMSCHLNRIMFWHLNRIMSWHLNRTMFWNLNRIVSCHLICIMSWHFNRIMSWLFSLFSTGAMLLNKGELFQQNFCFIFSIYSCSLPRLLLYFIK